MPKQATKIKLSSLNGPASRTAHSPADKTAADKSARPQNSKERSTRPSLLPGGPLLWCLMGLAIGLAVWLGGRSYLKQTLAAQLSSTSSEAVALQSIDALLRLDADATIEVSRGLAHPEFMVANAAFRALGGQLDAWTKLEPADRLQRMQKVVSELERIPDDIDQDHRILVSGLASRIYADMLSSREAGTNEVLEACLRVMARTDPQYAPRVAGREPLALPALNSTSSLPRANEDTNQVPPPLAPLDPPSLPAANPPAAPGAEQPRLLDQTTNDQAANDPNRRSKFSPTSIASGQIDDSGHRMHLTAGNTQLPQSTNASRGANSMPNLKSAAPTAPLSPSASSRTRIIPRNVEPLPMAEGPTEPDVPLAGLENLPIDQLVRLLASVQPRVSQAAALNLRQRGMTDENLEMAIQLANGSAEVRNQWLDQLVQREDVDARPWLLWMAEDGQESVRQHAVALLTPLVDNDVRRQLRLLLNREGDEKVAQTIRQVLAR